MPLQRGEVRSYDFNRMVLEFTMLNQGKVILCAISTAAMDDLEGRHDVKADQRVDQFIRLREVIEERASRKFFGEQAQWPCTRFRRHRVRCFYGTGGEVMERRRFTREFKLEAVRLIRDRGVSYAQASEDLKVHPTQLRNWVKAFADDPQYAFPGQGQMKPEQLEIAQLKREVIKLKAERDILKKAAAYFAKEST